MAEEKKTARVSHEYVAVPKASLRRRRHHSRHHSRGFGTEGVLLTVGAGAVVALLANLDDLKDSKSVKEHWWLIPIVVVAIGYFLRRRGNPYGGVVMAVGGALFALAYAANQKANTQQQQAAPPKNVKPGETGAIDSAGALPMLLPAGGGQAWLKLPNGQLLRVPLFAKDQPQLPIGMPIPARPNNAAMPLGVN